MILKYVYMLDVFVPHIVHMTYFDYTLPILQNFEKTKCANELHSSFLRSDCFLKVLENWQGVVKICRVNNVSFQNV